MRVITLPIKRATAKNLTECYQSLVQAKQRYEDHLRSILTENEMEDGVVLGVSMDPPELTLRVSEVPDIQPAEVA